MEIIGISALLVAIAEMGDKTQLLAIVLAAKFKRPLPIILGILAATLANHGLAALGGYYIADLLKGRWFQIAVSLGFVAMAAWTLVPDKAEDAVPAPKGLGVFATTVAAFFVVEIGDKTQVATVALAARFHDVVLVAAGTTLGMMAANIPAVLLADKATKVVPLAYMRAAAAAIFLGLGLWGLAGAW